MLGPCIRSQIGLAQMPGIAHWRKAIANVRHSGRDTGCLGNAVAAAHDQVAFRYAPGSNCQRHDRQREPITAPDAGQRLQPTGVQRGLFEDRNDATGSMKKSV